MSMFTRNPFKQETGSSKEMKALAHEAANDSVEKIVDSMRSEHDETRKQVEKARVEVATNSEILAALRRRSLTYPRSSSLWLTARLPRITSYRSQRIRLLMLLSGLKSSLIISRSRKRP